MKKNYWINESNFGSCVQWWCVLFFGSYLSVRSQRQTVPSSQTQIKMFPSRENVVWRMGDVHFGCVSVTARINVGSGVLMSQRNTLPHWLPSAINLAWWSSANRMNQISHSLYSKRCKMDAVESPCLNSLELSFKRPGFQHTIEFSQDYREKKLPFSFLSNQFEFCRIQNLKFTYLWHNKVPNPSYTVN